MSFVYPPPSPFLLHHYHIEVHINCRIFTERSRGLQNVICLFRVFRYAWTIAECAQCGNHLGWRFTAAKRGLSPSKFWGLTRAALKPTLIYEEDDSEGKTLRSTPTTPWLWYPPTRMADHATPPYWVIIRAWYIFPDRCCSQENGLKEHNGFFPHW